MEAKDTYIMESKNKLMVLTCHDDLSRELWVDALISEQAEISYKAGKKEVVDWVNKHGITHGVVGSKFILSPHTSFNSTGWQAKLKEWHIETD